MLLTATASLRWLLLAGASLVAAREALVNRQVKEVIYLNSPVLRTEYSIVAGLAEEATDPVQHYRVIIPPEAASKLAIITALLDGQGGRPTLMPISEVTDPSCPHFARCFVISLPRPLDHRDNPKISFGVGLTYVDSLTLIKPEAGQTDLPQFRAALSPYFYSPYPTKKQKTVIMLVKEFELIGLDCPKPHNLSPSSSPSGLGGIPGSSQFTCGPYQNIPPMHAQAGALWVAFRAARIPFFEISRLERVVEVDLVNRRLLCTEDYEVAHLGHTLRNKGFNRAAFIKDVSVKGGSHGQTVPAIPMSVPKVAEKFKIRDEVGLIHSSLRRIPSPLQPEHSYIIEVQPRFPLQGGWSMAWRLTYEMPLGPFLAAATEEASSGGKGRRGLRRLLLPLFEIFHDVPVKSFSFSVILPADAAIHGPTPIATSVEAFIRARESQELPAPLRASRRQLHRIRLGNVCKEHQGLAMVQFELSWWKMYRQPVLASLMMVLLGFLAVTLLSLDWSLQARPAGSKTSAKATSRLAKLFRDRRALLRVLDERGGGMDGESRQVVLQDVEYVGNQISQQLAGETANHRESQMLTAALLKLYSDQLGKIRGILAESEGTATLVRLERDAVDLDQRILQNEARLLAERDGQ